MFLYATAIISVTKYNFHLRIVKPAYKIESRQLTELKPFDRLYLGWWKLPGNRSQVQGSTFRVKDKEGIKDPKSSLKMLIFPNNCQYGSKFWIRLDDADAFLVNTHPKCSPGTRLEPLAQTWRVKMWWWKAKPIEFANNFITTLGRTRAGLNPWTFKPVNAYKER